MKYKKKIYFLSLLAFMLFVLSGCDVGINDLQNGGDIPGWGDVPNLDIRDILKPEDSYKYLLEELEFMNDETYLDPELADAQTFKILMAYSLADMSTKSSELTENQIEIRADLYNTIKLMYAYVSTYTGTYIYGVVKIRTNQAITYCEQMIETFGNEDINAEN
jgi:hypothetical protein